MSRLIKLTTSLILSAVMVLSVFAGVSAVESTPDIPFDAERITVTADEIEKQSFSDAVQSALDKARDEGENGKTTIVEVEQGDYELSRGVRIYGNTVLSLYGVTIRRAQNVFVNMLRTGDEDSSYRGVTGYHYENILIQGGVFDAELTVQTMIKVAHARNFKMKDVTLLNVKDNHMMEVAGVDGFTLENCAFKNQVVDPETALDICYEAVQLDVLKAGHIVNCRSEDLPMKDVLIEGCTFEDLPRAVGSHTAILNNPFKNITIRNNTFKNMTSVAVQGLGWVNCTITDNYIEKTPRAVAVYSVTSEGRGTYLASVLAEEGGVPTDTVEDYSEPIDTNTTIAYNTIKECGGVEDTLGNYKVSAISAMGYRLDEVFERGKDNSAGLPVGDYFLNGVSVHDNYIEVQGTGIRLQNLRNAEAVSNSVNCTPSAFYPENDYQGIVVRDNSVVSAVKNNYIKNAKINGIHIGQGCEIDELSFNKIDSTQKYGIASYQAKINKFCDNDVSNCAVCGIGIMTNTKIESDIARNRITSCDTGIRLTEFSEGFINCNTFIKCNSPMKYEKTILRWTTGNNYTDNSVTDGISLNEKEITVSKGRYYKIQASAVPFNADNNLSFTSSDESVASVDDGGFIKALAEGSAVITVKSVDGKSADVYVNVISEKEETKTVPAVETAKIATIYNNGSGVRVTWDKIKGASKYHLLRKNGEIWERVTETISLSYLDKNVVSGTEYNYTVQAIDKDGGVAGSYDNTGLTLTYVSMASVPKFTNSKDDIKLEWNKVDGASYYRVFQKTGVGEWSHLYSTSKTVRRFKPVVSGESYSFIIIPLDKNKDPLNTYNKSGYTAKFLSKPSIKIVKKSKLGKKIKLEWTKINGAKKYLLKVLKPYSRFEKKIVIKKKKKVVKKKEIVTYKWRQKTLSTNGLVYEGKYDKTYTFTVQAIGSDKNNPSVFSDSKVYKFKKPVVKKAKKKTSLAKSKKR